MLSPCICGAAHGRRQLARKRQPPAQPRSTFGSPEDLIERGTGALAKQTERLGRAVARAVEGKTSARAINAAIKATARRWNRERFADPLERAFVHAQWLGALDSDFEARSGRPVAVPSFSALHSIGLTYDKTKDPAFSTRTVKEAREEFEKREPVTRDVYDAMNAAARRRAVTVAGAASNEVVRSVQRELEQQVAQGSDLRDFSKRVVPRLEQAGWTPQNPSHVENVLRTNVGTAYNAGRYRQMTQPGVLRYRPFFQIVTVNDGPPRQRKSHQGAHLAVLRADDPFWLTAYPPFGYQCRCRVRSLGRREGEKLVESGAALSRRLPEPGLPDPGFTSGIANLDVPPVPPIPEGPPPANDTLPPGPVPPANDTLPDLPPANDTTRPKPPRKKKPKPPPEPERPVPTHEQLRRGYDDEFEAKRLGVERVRIVGIAAEADRGKVVDELEAVGLKEFCKTRPLQTLTLTAKRNLKSETWDPWSDELEGRAFGYAANSGSQSTIKICTDAPDRRPAPHHGDVPLAAPFRSESVNTAVHEFGHSVHLYRVGADAQREHAEADRIVFRRFGASDREKVSNYSLDNRDEYFAESFLVYWGDNAWLRRNAPKALKMVEDVLGLRGMPLHGAKRRK